MSLDQGINSFPLLFVCLSGLLKFDKHVCFGLLVWQLSNMDEVSKITSRTAWLLLKGCTHHVTLVSAIAKYKIKVMLNRTVVDITNFLTCKVSRHVIKGDKPRIQVLSLVHHHPNSQFGVC